VEIEIAAGQAEQPLYSFQFARIDLGRCTHVRDRRNQLVRTNHVAFADTDDALNQTVSRRHSASRVQRHASAPIAYTTTGASTGTVVSRAAARLWVPPGARGVAPAARRRDPAGNARLRVRLTPPTLTPQAPRESIAQPVRRERRRTLGTSEPVSLVDAPVHYGAPLTELSFDASNIRHQ
jgi:hypothetical protein